MEKYELLLAKLASDNLSGSDQLVPHALDVLKAALEDKDRDEKTLFCRVNSFIELVKQELSEFTTLDKIADKLKKIPKDRLRIELKEIIDNVEFTRQKQLKELFERGAKYIQDGQRVFTISQSGSILGILKKAKTQGKDFDVTVAYSGPAGEGVEMFKKLREIDISVRMVPDYSIGYSIMDCDIILVGAETITNKYFSNKIGSFTIALLANYYNIPVYVGARSEKYRDTDDVIVYKSVDSFELDEDNLDVEIENTPLFEVVPYKLIDGIITEKGVYKPKNGKIRI